MKKAILFCLSIMLLTLGSSTQVFAGKFDPLFRVTTIQGTCTITPPGKTAEPAVDQKAYPYGSRINTGRNSSLVCLLSDGNEVQILGNADVEMKEDAKDPKIKIIKLHEGKVEANLEHEFNKENSLNVETPVAICGAIACKFYVDSRTEEDLRVILFGVSEGKVKVFGDHFEVPELDVDDLITLSASLDREFIRIKNVKGAISINVKDSSGTPQTIDLKVNSLVKIWSRRADLGNNRVITIIITAPDGRTTEHAFNFTEPDTRSPEDLVKLKDQITKDMKEAPKKVQDREREEDERNPIVTTTTTTTTTVTTTTRSSTSGSIIEVRPVIPPTTTTRSSPTPVGRR